MKLVSTNVQQSELSEHAERALLIHTATLRMNQEMTDKITEATALANITYGMKISKSDIIKRAIALGLSQLEVTLKQQSKLAQGGK